MWSTQPPPPPKHTHTLDCIRRSMTAERGYWGHSLERISWESIYNFFFVIAKAPSPLSRSGSRSIPIHQIGGERQKRTGIVWHRKRRSSSDVRTGKKRTGKNFQIGKKFWTCSKFLAVLPDQNFTTYLFIYLFPFYFHRVALSVDKLIYKGALQHNTNNTNFDIQIYIINMKYEVGKITTYNVQKHNTKVKKKKKKMTYNRKASGKSVMTA